MTAKKHLLGHQEEDSSTNKCLQANILAWKHNERSSTAKYCLDNSTEERDVDLS